MPLQQCQAKGVRGWRWGRAGKCYVGGGSRAKAVQQGRAIESSVAENKELSDESGNGRKSVGSLGSLSTNSRHSNQSCGYSGSTNNESGEADSGTGKGTVATAEGNEGIEASSTKDSIQQIVNQRKRKRVSFANPLRMDPTRTTTLRRIFEQQFSARFLKLKGAILRLVVDEDAFGLRQTFNQEELSDDRERNVTDANADSPLGRIRGNTGKGTNCVEKTSRNARNTANSSGEEIGRVWNQGVANQRFAFQSTPRQVQAFNAWLQTQIQADIITTTAEQAENAYWTKYVQQGYEKGAGRAFDDANIARRAQAGGSEQLAFIEGTREQFLQSAFAQPVAIDKVKILAGRVFTELNNVTTAMATTMSRTLVEGLARGDNPRKIARELNRAVEGIGRTRSRAIAQTEIIRAHAEGQLDAMEQMGMEKVGVMVEWSAAGDDRTCPRCLDLDGVVLKLKEARGIIPRHPNCRCAFIPANVGESTKDQIRGKANIQKAIDDSIRVDIPKGRVIKGVGRRYKDPETGLFTSTTKRTLAQQKKVSKWPGADLTPGKVRPKHVAAGEVEKFRITKPKAVSKPKPVTRKVEPRAKLEPASKVTIPKKKLRAVKPKAKPTPKKPLVDKTGQLKKQLEEQKAKNLAMRKELDKIKADTAKARTKVEKAQAQATAKEKEVTDLKRQIRKKEAEVKDIDRKLKAQDVAHEAELRRKGITGFVK